MHASDPAQTFLLEANDLLDEIEAIALSAAERPLDAEAVNRLFRAFHTIKGSGSMFGFEGVAGFTHHFESALDRVRSGRVPLSPRFIELILTARDHIKLLLDGPAAGTPASAQASGDIIAAIVGLLDANAIEAAPAQSLAASADDTTTALWRVRFRPSPKIAASGLDPAVLLHELRGLGSCRVTPLLETVPPLENLHAEDCHVGWEIVFATPVSQNAIRDVFIFVEGDSEVVIEPATDAPPSQAVVPPPSPSPGSLRKAETRDASIRVPSTRLDRLVNLVGELVMNQSRLIAVAARIDRAELHAPVEDLERLIAEVRDTVLGIRMMPIGTTFTRFKRLVHDLSGELEKEIDLVTAGAETELDKTVLDQLGDPLVHLIRNSIDHGIEAPEERVAAGKPRRGAIRLAAAHSGSNVVITVEDDGRGLDPAVLRAKAIEKKLISPDAELSEEKIFELILLPGFSTAKKVTSVSGRGVGMDVVKREIDALGGSLRISSRHGQGTTISATLPLTLAIIDGLLVEIGPDQFIIPMSAVQENVELTQADRRRNNGRNLVAVRGELVPYVPLREAFAVGGEEPAIEKIVIVRHGADRVGLVVDRVVGSHQTVIQSLGRFYRGIEVLSGATIMGDGRVALILDLRGVIRVAESRLRAKPALRA